MIDSYEEMGAASVEEGQGDYQDNYKSSSRQ